STTDSSALGEEREIGRGRGLLILSPRFFPRTTSSASKENGHQGLSAEEAEGDGFPIGKWGVQFHKGSDLGTNGACVGHGHRARWNQAVGNFTIVSEFRNRKHRFPTMKLLSTMRPQLPSAKRGHASV